MVEGSATGLENSTTTPLFSPSFSPAGRTLTASGPEPCRSAFTTRFSTMRVSASRLAVTTASPQSSSGSQPRASNSG